jgi:hypothetical protein
MRNSARGVVTALVCGLATAASSASAASASLPTVISIAPNNGSVAGGTSVALAGSGFTAASTVRFGATAATNVKILSTESMLVRSPPGRGGEPVDITVTSAAGTSAPSPNDQFAYDPPPASAWLGLDGNSGGVPRQRLEEFVREKIVYDRGGAPGLNWVAGELPVEDGRTTEGGRALAISTRAGMIPDVVIDYRGYRGNYRSDPDFPQERTPSEEAEGRETINGYVAGFVKSAKAIHRKYPRAIFEPINEPWGYTTPEYNGAAYAEVIARLLPQAKAAGIPLSSIYVAATGKGCTAEADAVHCAGNDWIPAMYAAQPMLQTEIQGWYLHPYGQPRGAGEGDGAGIQSVPLVQAAMTSGQNNIVVSEVGYCADDVNSAVDCGGWPPERSAQATRSLTEMLDNALPYHEAGWLRALLVYSRSDGGWAMQLADGALTAQGRALQKFARSH